MYSNVLIYAKVRYLSHDMGLDILTRQYTNSITKSSSELFLYEIFTIMLVIIS